jgi:exopolysaccharide biosynthesis polyprenyl glycosylphosphotransferase
MARVQPSVVSGAGLVDMKTWLVSLAVLDLAAGSVASVAGALLRFEPSDTVSGIPYASLTAMMPPFWLLGLLVAGAYDRRVLVAGAEEFRRIGNATVWLMATLAFVSFLLRAELPRGFVVIILPLAMCVTLVTRYGVRKLLHRQLTVSDRTVHKAVAVGTPGEVRDLISHMRRMPFVGFRVVGVCLVDQQLAENVDTSHEVVLEKCHRLGANTIAVAGSHAFSSRELRELSWALEETHVELVVAPSVTDVAGPRIRIRPVDGLPLLYIDKPRFTGTQRVAKELFDRTAAALLALTLFPLFVLIALAVRLNSRGPVFFRQTRVGIHGREFSILKFRTMGSGADAEKARLRNLNEHEGLLFKMRRDPRATRVGRWLRRFSLDELPQLWNVLTGSMSLVGPRPPIPDEVSEYADDARRRLLVKPGMTGLWQVSGRADLTWQDTVRLDLYYVENWSVALDCLVLWKTFGAIVHGRGAY